MGRSDDDLRTKTTSNLHVRFVWRKLKSPVVRLYRPRYIIFAISPDFSKVWRCATIRQTKERWLELCEQAATEEDSAKLYALVQEINRLLEEKQTQLNHARMAERNPPANPSGF